MTSVVNGFDLQGYRGARDPMPENTLPGFATALAGNSTRHPGLWPNYVNCQLDFTYPGNPHA